MRGIQHNVFRYMFFIESEGGDVSLAIAFISGMPKPLVVNDGVMVFVDRGQCLNE